jgi:head-tail adaptor
MRTAITIEAECRQVPRGSVITGAKEDASSTGRVWAAGLHHVTARSRLGARFETYEPFISLIFNFFRAAVNRGY